MPRKTSGSNPRAARATGARGPLEPLSATAAAIAAGDRAQRLPLDVDPPLRRLVESVNAIVDTLALKERLLGDNIQSLQRANRELREAQESLLRSEKMAAVGRVSAGIAHEIGNP